MNNAFSKTESNGSGINLKNDIKYVQPDLSEKDHRDFLQKKQNETGAGVLVGNVELMPEYKPKF